ncbi:MAG: stage 0 sporulation family protein [Clostridiales bacterium]|nr:stage 0 sporulation family protein [Clostridiales bacterium]
MSMVVGVRFKNAGKLYYFDPGPLWPVAGDFIIVETMRGIEYAQCILGVQKINEEDITAPLKPVLRIATHEDTLQHKSNLESEKSVYQVCHQKIDEHRLDMKLVKVEYTFDRNKLTAYFTSGGRVDFRTLVKDLAATFMTRIELKQIGVRDEAKMLGGLGSCGRPLCCSEFLGDFEPVSIKMAKEQNLSLNPTKISGVCGRLMCCLKYEQEQYERARKLLPQIGRDVMTPDGRGTVVEINTLKENVKVRIPKGSDGYEYKEFLGTLVQRIVPPPAVKQTRSQEDKTIKKNEKPKAYIVPDTEDDDSHHMAATEATVAEHNMHIN